MDKLEIKAEVSIDDAGTITGLAWPFGDADSVGDIIEKGAFEMPVAVPMMLEHGRTFDGAIGIWTGVVETDAGLEVKGQLFVDAIKPAKQVRHLFGKGAVTGLSIGFKGGAFEPLPTGGRKFSAVTLTEISLCARPVHPGARITSVKSINQEPRMEPATDETAALEQKAANDNFAKLTARLDKIEAKSNRPVAANDNEPLAGLKAFGDELRTTMLERKALTIAAPGTGGNLVPDEFSASILEKVRAFSPVRQLASNVSVSGSLLQIPRLVNSVVPGSITEVGAKPESEPTFEQIDIKPFAMGVLVPVSRSTLEDSAIDLTNYLTNHIVAECATLESEWFVKGNGTTQAEGVLTSTAIAAIEATAITTDALLDVLYGIKSAYSLNGAWLMNRKTMRIIRGLRDSDGNLLWQPGLQAGQPGLLLDKPVYEADHMPDPAVGASPIVFGDFARGYLITDRITFEPHIDYDTRYANDIVVFGGRRRVGGKVVMGEALTKLKLKA